MAESSAGAPAGEVAPTAHEASREKRPIGRGRRILVQVIIWGTTVLAVVAIFAVWANRQLLNPNNWANTSTKLLEHPAVRTATASYLVNQLYANVDVAGELRSRLPPALQPAAGPLAGALENAAVSAAARVLANPRGQDALRAGRPAAAQT